MLARNMPLLLWLWARPLPGLSCAPNQTGIFADPLESKLFHSLKESNIRLDLDKDLLLSHNDRQKNNEPLSEEFDCIIVSILY